MAGLNGVEAAIAPLSNRRHPMTKTPTKPASKISAVVALLRCEGGATLAELVAATGWQPHTTRSALTGLRKKGHVIERSTRDGAAAYSIAAS